MSQRRVDEETGMTVEYALFLAETRGLKFALGYLESCHVPTDVLLRTVDNPQARRHHERRRQPRN
jgi:hypothetical protein